MSNFHKNKQLAKQNKVYTLTQAQIYKIKKDASDEAIDIAFILMLGLPVLVMHDKYGQLIKREVDGVGREERFTDLVLEQYEAFNAGYLTLDDILLALKEECGLDITKKKGEKK